MHLLRAAVVCAAASVPAIVSAETRYSVTQLDAAGSTTESWALTINSEGVAGGWGFAKGEAEHQALVWSGGSALSLGVSPARVGQVNALNDAGDAVGYLGFRDPEFARPYNVGYAYRGGVFTYYPVAPDPGALFPMGINNAGFIVGAGMNGAAMDVNGTVIPLTGIPSSSSAAHAINNSGLVVGKVATKPNMEEVRGFVWDGGEVTIIPSLGGNWAQASDVNDAGMVVGTSQYASGLYRGFVWVGGDPVALTVPIGFGHAYAVAVNDGGQIVGQAMDASGVGHAALWDDGKFVDLNDLLPDDSGWTLLQAKDINDVGQIVGVGLFDGQVQAFLLTPSLPSPIPEPVLVPSVLAATALRRGRRLGKPVRCSHPGNGGLD